MHGMTMTPLEARFQSFSPRLNRRPTTFATVALHGGALVMLILLALQVVHQTGLLAWSVGLAYIVYDTILIAFVAVKSWPLRRPPAQAPLEKDTQTLAVLLAAHNEAAVLASTIHALLRQDMPPDIILIADDGSTDDTPAVLRREFAMIPAWSGSPATSPILPSLRWLCLPHGGKARALNAALACIDCDIVLTVDADTHLAPGAIAAMRSAFQREPELVAATGLLAPICDLSLSGRLFQWFQSYEYVRNFISRYAWMQVDGLLLISGAFAGFRRKALLDVGGFDPECLVEDYEVIHRLHRHSVERDAGWKIRVLGDARAQTDAPGNLAAFLKQRRRWFGGFLQTQFWNRDMVGNARFGRLGTMMLPVKAFDTVQPIFGLTAFALLLFFLATGQFVTVWPILVVMAIKVVIDLGFHCWSITLYRRWSGGMMPNGWAPILLASVVEPFSFQLLRHLGAALGWGAFLTGSSGWGRQERKGIARHVPVAGEEAQA
ncbi:MAG TPA: glycosyltransferase family 2 protein [Sphingobium sp.]|nr:glycosyltransferase family 2 protein [Sphingobium sp.]